MKYRNKKFALFVVAVVLIPFILPFGYYLVFEGGIKQEDGSDYTAAMVLGLFSCMIFLLPCIITWKIWNGKTGSHFYVFLLLLIILEAIATSAVVTVIDAEAGFYLGLWYFMSGTTFAVPNILSLCLLGFMSNSLIKSSKKEPSDELSK